MCVLPRIKRGEVKTRAWKVLEREREVMGLHTAGTMSRGMLTHAGRPQELVASISLLTLYLLICSSVLQRISFQTSHGASPCTLYKYKHGVYGTKYVSARYKGMRVHTPHLARVHAPAAAAINLAAAR